ncbi:MAG: hypothetical protein Q4F92_02985 [Acidaminococcus sp.]|uniref:hypothetical protein n=1 Tax=Acidaminococcus sp. TaxID=1872103 RepID=UPI0026DF5B49|nr:hypothetical protein [Acidaminococcus sp.]MDO5597294.1 hypothetical protein [Acidaminococcus sp.]
MDCKVNDDFLIKVDALLDSTTDVFQHADALLGAGVVLVDLITYERMRKRFIDLCDAMEEYFPEFGKEDGDEKETEECTDPGDSDPAAVFDYPDDVGCDNSTD